MGVKEARIAATRFPGEAWLPPGDGFGDVRELRIGREMSGFGGDDSIRLYPISGYITHQRGIGLSPSQGRAAWAGRPGAINCKWRIPFSSMVISSGEPPSGIKAQPQRSPTSSIK